MMLLETDATAFNEIGADFAALALTMSKFGKFRSALERMRDEVFIPEIERQFSVEGDPAWQALSETTIARRGGYGTILDDTGALRRAAPAKARFTIRDNELSYGNWPITRWFGPLHNLGLGGMPMRPWTLVNSDMADGVVDITWDWFEARIDKHIKLRYS